MSSCSIVIRCYNEEQHIGKLLKGISEQDFTDYEIIIVDSGSTDATLAIATQYPVKVVSIKPSEFTFGRSLNLGCQAATGDYIVIVSAHVYPLYSDWLSNLIAPFEDPQVALTYGRQQGNEQTKYSEHQVFAKWFPLTSNFNQTTPFCNNANAAIRRSLWTKNPYDESLTGLEDLDWGKQAQKLGYKLAYVADASIVHVHEETPARICNRYRREAIALKRILPEERFYFTDFLRLFFGNVISDYYHAWHDGMLPKKGGEIIMFRLMQFWGTYQGYRDRVNNQLREKFYYPNGLKRTQLTPRKQAYAINYAKASLKEKQLEQNY